MRKAAAVLAGLVLNVVLVSTSLAQPYSREGHWEFFLGGQVISSQDITFNDALGTVTTKMDTAGLGGFGLGYHLTDNIALRGDFMFGGTTFYSTGPDIAGRLAQDAFIQTASFNLDWNILKQRFTPFLTAGIGYQYFSVELVNAPPVETCWWDPWWGWVCGFEKPTHNETDFTWNVGGGLRWDMNNRFFLKALVDANWLQFSGAQGITTQIRGTFGVGVTY